MKDQGTQIGMPSDLDAILVVKLSFIPCRRRQLARDGSYRPIGSQNDFRVAGASEIKDVVDVLLMVWRDASENSDKTSWSAFLSTRNCDHRFPGDSLPMREC